MIGWTPVVPQVYTWSQEEGCPVTWAGGGGQVSSGQACLSLSGVKAEPGQHKEAPEGE